MRTVVIMGYEDTHAVREYALFNEKLNRMYSDKHGLDFYCSHDDPRGFSRMMVSYLADYEYVVGVDADAFFYLDSLSIESIMSQYPTASMICSHDEYNDGIHAGILIAKNDSWTITFLERWACNPDNGLKTLWDDNVLSIQTHCALVPYGTLQHFHCDELLFLPHKPILYHGSKKSIEERIHLSRKYMGYMTGFFETGEWNGAPEKKGKLVISWYSHTPDLNTGYGTQTKQVVSRLKREGHSVCINPMVGGKKCKTEFMTDFGDRVPIYPEGNLMFSNDMGPLNYMKQKYEYLSQGLSPTILLGLLDIDTMEGEAWNEVPMYLWVPIATTPLPPQMKDRLQKPNVKAIAMSAFGVEVMKEAGIQVFGYVPHTFEEDIFVPQKLIKGIPVRSFLHIDEDCFLVGMMVSNFEKMSVHRKAFAECVMAFRDFAQGKKNVKLYMHTDMRGTLGGIDLMEMCTRFGVDKNLIVFPDPMFFLYESDREAVAALCSACDVGLVTSYGEGFGLATIEFQAVGTPVIATDFSASPELLGPDSIKVPGQLLYDYVQQTFFKIPHIPSMVDALDHFYFTEHKKVWPDTLRFARDHFAGNVVFERHWKPVLERIYEHQLSLETKSKHRDLWFRERRRELMFR
jgi:glycosyltransferase involved in cell wall biosynthesis